jgi:hypothetical protein
LIAAHPSASGLLVADLEAPGRAAAVTSLVRAIGDVVREQGLRLAVRVPCPPEDEDLSIFAAVRGVDLNALGALADTLYLDLGALMDADGDGVEDRDPTEIGAAVEYVGMLDLPAALAVVVPTDDPQTPEQIAATVSALPGGMISGIAVCRYADTSAAEWEAFLNANPR